MDVDDRYRRLLAGRRVLLASDALAGATRIVEKLRELGTTDIAVISASDGVGDLPEGITSIRVETPAATSIMGALRDFQQQVASLPPEALDHWDPDRSAVFLAGPFDRGTQVAGREAFGSRPDAFVELEDKTTVDDLWEQAGIPRAPSRVVKADPGELASAARELDRGRGTVWVADNREGWHGGGDYLRWVKSPDDTDDAVSFFTDHAHRVRVMPFLEGIPCSIHGVVLADRVLAFRPVELLILRRRGEPTLQYGGLATLWDPDPADREEMRSAARRVGDALRSRVGYRGVFGIDGIMTAEGFRPTELNPRLTVGAGIQGMAAGIGLGMVNRLILAGEVDGLDGAELERTVVEGADAHRAVHCHFPLRTAPPAWTKVGLDWTGERWRHHDQDDPVATLEAGPHPIGMLLRLEVDAERMERGAPFGPKAAAALDLARRRGVDVPEVDPAPDVRRR